MSMSAEDMATAMSSIPVGSAGVPTPPDPIQQDINAYTHAYGLAAKDGNQEVMSAIHGKLLNAYQRKSARDENPAEGGGHLFTGSQPGLDQTVEGFGRGVAKIADVTSDALSGKNEAAALGLADTDTTQHGTKLTSPAVDKALLDTTHGQVGNVAGQVAATLPLAGTGEAALGTAGLAGRAGPGLAATLGRVGARAAGSGLEAGTAGAVTGEDPLTTGEAGAALGVGGKVLGRTLSGLVGKSPDTASLYAKALDSAAEGGPGKDFFVPISQGGTQPAKGIYQKMFPYFLGAQEQLEGQSTKAKDIISQLEEKQGLPFQVDETGKGGTVPSSTGTTSQQRAADMKSTYDRAYQDTVKSYAFKPPEDFHANVLDNLVDSGLPPSHQAQIAGTLDEILQDHLSKDGTLSGENLLRAKAAGREALGNLRSSGGLAPLGNPDSTQKALGSFDDIVQSTIEEHKEMAGTAKAKGVQSFMDDFNDMSREHENVGKAGRRLGSATVDLSPHPDMPNTIHIESMEADNPKSPIQGGRAMKTLMNLADEHQVNLEGSAVQLGNQGPSREGLDALYTKAGGKSTGETSTSRLREPKPPTGDEAQASSVVRDLQNFQRLAPAYAEGNAFITTAEKNKANRGAINHGQLAQAAPDESQMQGLAQEAHSVLEQESPGGVSPAGRHMLSIPRELGGPAIATYLGGPAAGLGALAGVNALSTKTAQKALYGDLASQQAVSRFLRAHPSATGALGFATRQGIIDNASGQ
jgi:hypothetical protein